MSASISRHRRKILLTTFVLVAAGYASYRVYKSPVLTRRRKQIFGLFRALSFLSNAVSESTEALSILSADLKTFLTSDNDEVPRSLRQAFKIGQCLEFRQSLVLFFAALTEGALQGTTRNGNLEKGDRARNPSLANDRMRVTVEASDQQETLLLTGMDLTQVAKSEQRTIVVEQVENASRTDMRVSMPGAEFLLDKLFSDSGTGFASVVVGSVARNLILALLSGLQETKKDADGPGISDIYNTGTERLSWNASSGQPCIEITEIPTQVTSGVVQTGSVTIGMHSAILDLLCSDKCRHLIAECIQNFVSSAVSVYIEKTKDINYYDDMVASITNPSHHARMKELLTSVCNCAVETFIRTSHEVLFSKSSTEAELSSSPQKSRMENLKKDSFDALDDMPVVLRCGDESIVQNDQQAGSSLSCSDKSDERDSTPVENLTVTSSKNTCSSSAEGSFPMLIDRKQPAEGWIEGISRTLAIPSNRMLVMDIAGKMTSEAVRSAFEVMTSTIRNFFKGRSSGEQSWLDVGNSNIAEGGKDQAKIIPKFIVEDLNVKLFVLATIFFALCLHVLVGASFLEPAK